MMKKMIGILMVVFMLGTIFSAINVNATAAEMKAVGNIKRNVNSYNFWIDKVAYAPDPSDPNITIFTVSVGAEGVPAGAGLHPNVASYVNGQLQDMFFVIFEEDGIQTCQLDGYDIDFSKDNVAIKVDPENIFPETNEGDNTWTNLLPDFIVSYLSAKYYRDYNCINVDVKISNIGGWFKKPYEDFTVVTSLSFEGYGVQKYCCFIYEGTGESGSGYITLSDLPEGVSTLNLVAKVDDFEGESEIDESNENNNVKNIKVKSAALPVQVNLIERLVALLPNAFPILQCSIQSSITPKIFSESMISTSATKPITPASQTINIEKPSSSQTISPSSTDLVVTVKTDKSYYWKNEPVEVTMYVTNNGNEDVTLLFGDSCIANFEVYNENNELVYNWSYDKYFLCVITYETIPSGETVEYFHFNGGGRWFQNDSDGNPVAGGKNYRIHGFLPGYPDYNDDTYLRISQFTSLAYSNSQSQSTSQSNPSSVPSQPISTQQSATSVTTPTPSSASSNIISQPSSPAVSSSSIISTTSSSSTSVSRPSSID